MWTRLFCNIHTETGGSLHNIVQAYFLNVRCNYQSFWVSYKKLLVGNKKLEVSIPHVLTFFDALILISLLSCDAHDHSPSITTFHPVKENNVY